MKKADILREIEKLTTLDMSHLDEEFIRIAEPVVSHPEYQKMKELEHHSASVFAHSVAVAYHSYLLAGRLGLDQVSITRGALLHDFFLYTFDEKRTSNNLIWEALKHSWRHPIEALSNAEKHFELNSKERNIIRAHMFPVGLPRTPEALVVSLVDKTLAVYEYMLNFSEIREHRYELRFGLLNLA